MKNLNIEDLLAVHGGCEEEGCVEAAAEATVEAVDVVEVVEAIVNPAEVQNVVEG